MNVVSFAESTMPSRPVEGHTRQSYKVGAGVWGDRGASLVTRVLESRRRLARRPAHDRRTTSVAQDHGLGLEPLNAYLEGSLAMDLKGSCAM